MLTDISSSRILLACIKYLSTCPCPRCLIIAGQIAAMGTTIDNQRRSHIREDTHWLRRMIKMVRSWIFEKGFGVESTKVSGILDVQSLLPTKVRLVSSLIMQFNVSYQCRVHFRSDFQNLVSIFTLCSCLTFCMSLNSASSRQS